MSWFSAVAAIALLALTGGFLALSLGVFNNGLPDLSTNAEPNSETVTGVIGLPDKPPTPVPTAPPESKASYRVSATLQQGQMCRDTDPAAVLAEIEVFSRSDQLIARIYCAGRELKYIDAIAGNGEVDRTYLLDNGRVRVKLYYSEGAVIKRDDFDAAGNPVPDGSQTPLSSGQIANHH